MEGKAIYLALDIGQLALSEVFCVIVWVSAECLLASGCFLGEKKGAGAKLQRQTLLSSGHTVYKQKDKKGLLRASALKIQSSKKRT